MFDEKKLFRNRDAEHHQHHLAVRSLGHLGDHGVRGASRGSVSLQSAPYHTFIKRIHYFPELKLSRLNPHKDFQKEALTNTLLFLLKKKTYHPRDTFLRMNTMLLYKYLFINLFRAQIVKAKSTKRFLKHSCKN